MRSLEGIHLRRAVTGDVPAMAECTLSDPISGGADRRMAAYLDGHHHPQQALPPRTAFIALDGGAVVGYIAGHRTKRHGCDGEVQYLFVAPEYRRRGIATALLKLLAEWFQTEGARKICVALAGDSPVQFRPFYENRGAAPLQKYWYGWEDIATALR